LKVLIYTNAFHPQIGGQETILRLLAEGLSLRSSRDVVVTVATPTPAGEFDDKKLPFNVVRAPSFVSLFRLYLEADVVHLAGPMMLPMVLAIMMRKPLVVEHHGFQTICPNGQLLYGPSQSLCSGHFMAHRHVKCMKCNSGLGLFQSIKMWLLTFPRRWICQRVTSNVLPTTWLGTLLRLNRMKTIVHGIPLTADSESCRPGQLPPNFVYVGRLVTSKGVRVLLNAVKAMMTEGLDFRVSIVGQGADRESLEALSQQLRIEPFVRFYGYVEDSHLKQIIDGASAVIMPSLAGEVFGLSAAENMSRGKLVIASDIGSLSEVIGDAGMTFPVGDSEALALLMREVVLHPNIAEDFGRKAHRRISRVFNLETMTNSHYNLYDDITFS
jgi:glycosyltransferase involved in cell wall biosynthesis